MMIVKMYFMLIITRIFFGRINEYEKKMFDIMNFKISINNFTKFENFNDLEPVVQKYMLNIE